MTGEMLDPSALDWAVWIGSLGIASVLLAWSLVRPRRAPRDRQDDES